MKRIAIVEDDAVIRQNYVDALTRSGYEVEAHAARPAATAAFKARLPDLAILDIGLGDEIDGGFSLCRDLRSMSATLPIIFLSARDSDFDVVSGFASWRGRLCDQGCQHAASAGAYRSTVSPAGSRTTAITGGGHPASRRADTGYQ